MRGMGEGLEGKARLVGLVAGDGRLPLLGAQAARERGWRTVAVGVTPTVDPELARWVDQLERIPAWEWERVVGTLLAAGVRDVVLLGKVPKGHLYGGALQGADARFIRIVSSLQDRSDDRLALAFIADLEREGLRVRDQAWLLDGLRAEPGVLSRRQPTPQEWQDIALGWRMAKAIAGLDIGQTVVVKAGAVVAVEAIEGTDATIRRAGQLAGRGTVAVKVGKPQQDPRFDLPTVGPDTVSTLADAGAAVLAFEAAATWLVDREALLAAADQHELAVVALAGPPDTG